MAKSKPLVISGPMDAKHVGGINVMGGMQPSMLDSYFNKIVLEPDETPSHTYTATGKIEVPKRSDTFAGTIRRPSLSLKRSLSKLRRKSISHVSQDHSPTESKSRDTRPIVRSESVKTKDSARSLSMQSSLSRLRQRVGLDRELHDVTPEHKPTTKETTIAPEPIKKDYTPLQVRKPLSRGTSHASTMHSERERRTANNSVQRNTSSSQRDLSTPQRIRPAVSHQPVAQSLISNRPARPKRADSGTAIALDNVPPMERPLPFQDIMAVKSFSERMELYKKTREYWAYADHGLIEWTGRASGPKYAPRRTQEHA
ncbi:hypothetical protein HBI56_025960 [Parastagonospora nodorum]|uniref:Uncharacterized protein n=2 Tax=Phaeosphaeria nodorum (strain SN15 / ATCC MYA-4574 / FGSC 10173) TaxID=321614 RepID=A0A7U2EXT1_PHANO|nr:hypothetical protein SNOG_02624 [Parastagonospora nodorum SN15]KAH3919380.1 hypothetical protein HBH56_013620 [Parastagonospora nodorum]EAT89355.1 hypothetical protein SNOG_02624 [Parastagonospora nodorum SN15]KAH3937299.1 hypothetical protein HBH54_020840 [Parastagonospora nodorum]KAH3953897.1 hypothetical protein HBH53_033240 [Parastagonospora nodorum]KAH3969299.1 hypothetical protein HBH51_125400 [Parastagonospora nodorum]